MRCKRSPDNDLICAKYSVLSNRSTRLLLLEAAAEMVRAQHGECGCPICTKIESAFALKPVNYKGGITPCPNTNPRQYPEKSDRRLTK